MLVCCTLSTLLLLYCLSLTFLLLLSAEEEEEEEEEVVVEGLSPPPAPPFWTCRMPQHALQERELEATLAFMEAKAAQLLESATSYATARREQPQTAV